MSAPNGDKGFHDGTFCPDALTLAHERMDAAIVNQIETALAWEAAGANIGCYSLPLAPFRALWTGTGR